MDEKTALERIRQGDKQLFALFLRKYEKIVNSIIYSMVFDIETTKDLTQDTFIKAYENLNSYNGNYEFKTWIAKIARNHTIDFIRKHKHTISLDEIDNESISDGKESAEDKNFIKKRVEHALAKLNEEERSIIVLKYFEGFSNFEIALALEMPENRINVKIFRAKEKMREFLNLEKSER
jgi:RNA polymerase sigma-70 factor (ECF subfamily)